MIGLPSAPDAGIDDGQMYRSLGELGVCALQRECRLTDVLGRDLMGNVEDLGLGICLEDGPFHARHEGIPGPVISCKGNDV